MPRGIEAGSSSPVDCCVNENHVPVDGQTSMGWPSTPCFAFEAKTQIFTHKPRRGDGVFHLCAGGVLHYAFCGRPPLYCRFRKERNTRAAVLAAGRVLTATPSRRDTGLSSGMTRTRPSYPASEKADSTDTPKPPATMDKIAPSSDAVTVRRGVSGGSSGSIYCSGLERKVSCSSRSSEMVSSCHGKSGSVPLFTICIKCKLGNHHHFPFHVTK